MNISDIITRLETADRLGADIDEPEGCRYIQISETLINQIIEALQCEKDIKVYDNWNGA